MYILLCRKMLFPLECKVSTFFFENKIKQNKNIPGTLKLQLVIQFLVILVKNVLTCDQDVYML